jgi:Uma2 family endonuclease
MSVMSTVFTPTRARLSVDQFHKMAETGIFSPESRLELIDGELIEMAPIGPRHMHLVNRLTHALVAAVGNTAIVSVQNPVALDDHTETYPDFALLRSQPDREGRLPTKDDVLLVIEVADTSLQYDRTLKAARYAASGINEVWIVNVAERILEIYREPNNGAYRVKLQAGAEDIVAPVALPGIALPLAGIF